MDYKRELAETFGVSKTIYSLTYPEVKEVAKTMYHRPELREVHDHTWTGSQDKYHDMFLDTWTDWAGANLGNLHRYNYRYPTNGSSEAIRDVITMISCRNYPSKNRDGEHIMRDGETRIHILEGEYEGYAAYASAYNVQMVVHSGGFNYGAMTDGDVVFISSPSAVNGRILDLEQIANDIDAANPNVMIMYDACYVGAHLGHMRHFLPSNVHTVFFSLSKVFGVYYDRIGGVLTSEELPGLYGNQWFKNINSLILGTALMRSFKPAELTTKYGAARYKAVTMIRKNMLNANCGMSHNYYDVSSNVMPIFNMPYNRAVELDPRFEGMNRVKGVLRLCITPVLDTLINIEGWRPSNEKS